MILAEQNSFMEERKEYEKEKNRPLGLFRLPFARLRLRRQSFAVVYPAFNIHDDLLPVALFQGSFFHGTKLIDESLLFHRAEFFDRSGLLCRSEFPVQSELSR